MTTKSNKWKSIGIWGLSGLAAFAFVGAGVTKLSGNAEMAANFAAWGFPAFFMTFIGLAEVAGALGLLIPRLRFLASAGLAGLMLGAAGTHLIYGDFANIAPSVILLVATSAIAWIHRPAFLRSGKGAPTPQAS